MLFSESIERIAEILTRNMPEETLLITRSAGEGSRILRMLAAGGKLIVGVRAVTPSGLAREICSGCFAGSGQKTILERDEARDIMFKTLLDMPEEGFFAGEHAKDRKTNELMFDAIMELEANAAGAVGGNDRLEALQSVREAYTAAKGNTLMDQADVLRYAADHADAYFAKSRPYVVTLGTYQFSKAEERLIRAAAADRLTVIDLPVPAGIELPVSHLGTFERGAELDTSKFRFAKCRGMETEARFIMRDILENEAKAEDCAIVFMSGEYRPILYSEAELFHVPITIAGGIPLTACDLYYTLTRLADWRVAEYDAEILRDMILNGGLKVNEKGRFLYRLRERNIGWGAARYTERFLTVAEDDETSPEMISEWRLFIETMLAVADQKGTIAEQKANIRVLLDMYTDVHSKESGSALASVRRCLSGINCLGDHETVLTRLLDLMKQGSYLSAQDEPGKVFAVPLSGAFLTGRKKLYICGMSRFCLQGGTQESPILLDEEKRQYKLPAVEDREIENIFRLHMTLLACGEDVTLSYCDYDTERMIDLTPTPEFVKLLGGRDAEAVSYIPEESVMASDFAARSELLHAIPAQAGSPDDSVDCAALDEATDYAEQFAEKAFSPSALEEAMACPFSFYLKRMLRLYPKQLPERGSDRWLAANELGSLCHEVLEHYFSADNNRTLKDIFDEELKKMRASRPDSTQSAMRRDTDKAWKMIERAVQWTEESSREVLATEQAFGRNDKSEPMQLTVGDRQIKLSGSIDRVDRLPDGGVAILDYKTGSPDRYRGHEDRKLQPYLYSLVYEQMNPNEHVADAGYLFLKDKAAYLPVPQTDQSRRVREKTVLTLLEWMCDEEQALTAAPEFVLSEDGIKGIGDTKERERCLKNCSAYCDFADFCTAKQQIRDAEAEKEEIEND